jgi:hypothetical protein
VIKDTHNHDFQALRIAIVFVHFFVSFPEKYPFEKQKVANIVPTGEHTFTAML